MKPSSAAPAALAGSIRDVAAPALSIERLTLTRFRSHRALTATFDPAPVVLTGSNGSGKTNLLEAISLLAPGQGMRRAVLADLATVGGDGAWAVAARLRKGGAGLDIGTGQQAGGGGALERARREVRIDGVVRAGSGVLGEHVEMLWVTPAMDGLFTGPASERRRFLDRLILCFDPTYRTGAGRFERAMQQRNRLLGDGARGGALLDGLERLMAETGVAIAAARAEAVAALSATIAARRLRDPGTPFPWAEIALEGELEAALATHAAVDVEDAYAERLARGRERDRAAGRTLAGPHRSDLLVGHGPKAMPARLSSTGEQKALLIGLVLAHAELTAERRDGEAPILLLDEIAAHLDPERRAGLFAEIVRLGSQAWLTGTDPEPFADLAGRAQFRRIEAGGAMAVSG